MSAITLDTFKTHCRLDDLAGTEDAYLLGLLDAAEEWLCKVTRRSIVELLEMGEGRLPATLGHAVMLLAAHWYDNRGVVGTSMTEVPYTLSTLVKPYMRLT